jgi:hypothetical protein
MRWYHSSWVRYPYPLVGGINRKVLNCIGATNSLTYYKKHATHHHRFQISSLFSYDRSIYPSPDAKLCHPSPLNFVSIAFTARGQAWLLPVNRLRPVLSWTLRPSAKDVINGMGRLVLYLQPAATAFHQILAHQLRIDIALVLLHGVAL